MKNLRELITQGYVDSAFVYYKSYLELTRQKFGEYSPETIEMLENEYLGFTRNKNQYDRNKVLLHYTNELRKKTFNYCDLRYNNYHLITQLMANNINNINISSNKLVNVTRSDSCLTFCFERIKWLKDVFGQYHYDIANTYKDISTVYYSINDGNKLKESLLNAITVYDNIDLNSSEIVAHDLNIFFHNSLILLTISRDYSTFDILINKYNEYVEKITSNQKKIHLYI